MYEVSVVRQGTNLEDNLICQKKKKKRIEIVLKLHIILTTQ